jgi:hypothetical protein|tara:strand:- start:27678 stop:28037 length:360 start_codon:yes stop_codon:yes gene_type:complete
MNEENEPTLSKAVVEYEVKVLKLITGEEVVSKIRDLEDKYELIEAIQFRWGFEYDADVGRNVERLQPTPFPTNANLGRYEIDKKFVMVVASPRSDALGVYHSFASSILNYNAGQPNPKT